MSTEEEKIEINIDELMLDKIEADQMRSKKSKASKQIGSLPEKSIIRLNTSESSNLGLQAALKKDNRMSGI